MIYIHLQLPLPWSGRSFTALETLGWTTWTNTSEEVSDESGSKINLWNRGKGTIPRGNVEISYSNQKFLESFESYFFGGV